MRISAVLLISLCWALPASGFFWKKDKNKGDKDKKGGPDDDNAIEEELYNGLSPVSVSPDGIPMVTLHNDQQIPLVGLGVEYLPPYLIPLMTASAMQEDKRTRLFDTTHISNNENLLAAGIAQGMERLDGSAVKKGEKIEVHVITKVWYTHLGYHRTALSVKESYATLKAAFGDSGDADMVDLKLHILLQWPRCYENIDWMNCEMDEQDVESHYQEAGPPPHQDKDAWKGSWKALEDLYLDQQFPVASIGVANFHFNDFQEMDAIGVRVIPHVVQVSLWSLLYDPLLVDYCTKKGVHIQIIDAIDGILADPSLVPNAHHHLLKVAGELFDASEDLEEDDVTPVQVILGWLIQQGVSVVPGTERLSELQRNSALALGSLPVLSHSQVEMVAHSVEAFLSGDDVEEDIHSYITFKAVSKDSMLYWQKPDGSGESKIAFIARGETFYETTYPKHHFRIYDARNKDIFIDYHVDARFGEHKSFDAYFE